MTVQFTEGTTAMSTGRQLIGWLEQRIARALVARPATPLILVGTMAMAGFGAAAMNPIRAQPAPSALVQPSLTLTAPHTFCYADPDGDGHTVCHILATQVSTVPNLGCTSDPDGDGTFICYYATDPTASN